MNCYLLLLSAVRQGICDGIEASRLELDGELIPKELIDLVVLRNRG
jgi:hypothetical protein